MAARRSASSATLSAAADPDDVPVPTPSSPPAALPTSADTPVRAVPKAKALPSRGAVVAGPKGKAKAKAKAPSTRVIKTVAKAKAATKSPKAKAAPKVVGRSLVKAIPAKEFASMASKVKKSSSSAALPGSGTWYFMSDLRKMKVGSDDPKAWTKYTPKMNTQLETAYTKGFKQYTMKFKDVEYIVKFGSMMQFRKDDKSLQRPVKRE